MYLSNLPNLLYPSLNPNFNSSSDKDEVKNFFLRLAINEDILQNVIFYEKYKVIGNDRPDNISEKIYGTPDYDWLILLTNNIIDFYNEWPLNDSEFYDQVTQKYAGKNYNDTIYYVTEEIKDSSDRILLKGDLKVDSNFSFYNPEKQVYTNPILPKTYLDVEKEENDKKRNILLIKKEYVTAIINSDLKQLYYEKTKNFVNTALREA